MRLLLLVLFVTISADIIVRSINIADRYKTVNNKTKSIRPTTTLLHALTKLKYEFKYFSYRFTSESFIEKYDN